ncbi:MAG: glycosyltransferase family 9 protein [Bacteroidetes bacterium]|nr:glycosyltransferase family 9 protein [Bacteroidota bacterium]
MTIAGALNLFKDIVYSLIGWASALGVGRRPRRGVLIVRVDEIGDYLLWRPYLEVILSSEKFRTEEVTLCGNLSWKGLFQTFDANLRVETIWMDKVRFKKDMTYRYRFLRNVFLSSYQIVINPTYSRDKRYDDAVVQAAAAPIRYGMAGNWENIRWYDHGYDRQLYTHRMDSSAEVLFEFFRNEAFAAFVVGNRPPPIFFLLDKARCAGIHLTLPQSYFIIFTGSRSPRRRWPIRFFIEVANFMHAQSGWTVVLCGGPSDRLQSDAFVRDYAGPCLDLTGQTALPALMTIIAGANCVVTVDTGSVHMAAAVGTPVFAVFNGSQYGRFAPYPSAVSKTVHCIYPKQIRAALDDPAQVRSTYRYKVDIPYDSVHPDDMMEVMNATKLWEDA